MRYGLPALIFLIEAAASGASRERLVVCSFVEDPSVVDWSMLTNAKLTAAAILKQGGVEMKWRNNRRPPECGKWMIAIQLSERTPDTMLPGAMGYAFPYESGGIRVRVFLDRLRPILSRTANWRGAILGHVIAHELTHALQGIARHSAWGLMKERWSEEDIQQMAVKPLGFTSTDLLLLRNGMAGHDTLGGK